MDLDKLKILYESKTSDELEEFIKESHHLDKKAIPVLVAVLESKGFENAQEKIDVHIKQTGKKEIEQSFNPKILGTRELSKRILEFIKQGVLESDFGKRLEAENIAYFSYKERHYKEWLVMVRMCFLKLDADPDYIGDPYRAIVKSFQLSHEDQERLVELANDSNFGRRILNILTFLAAGIFGIYVGNLEDEGWPIYLGIGALALASIKIIRIVNPPKPKTLDWKEL